MPEGSERSVRLHFSLSPALLRPLPRPLPPSRRCCCCCTTLRLTLDKPCGFTTRPPAPRHLANEDSLTTVTLRLRDTSCQPPLLIAVKAVAQGAGPETRGSELETQGPRGRWPQRNFAAQPAQHKTHDSLLTAHYTLGPHTGRHTAQLTAQLTTTPRPKVSPRTPRRH